MKRLILLAAVAVLIILATLAWLTHTIGELE
jgi:hypothetical protein